MKRLFVLVLVVVLVLTLIASTAPAYAGTPGYQLTLYVPSDRVIEVFHGGACATNGMGYEGSSWHLGDYPVGTSTIKMTVELDKVICMVSWPDYELLATVVTLGDPNAVIGSGHLPVWVGAPSYAMSSGVGEVNFGYLSPEDTPNYDLAIGEDGVKVAAQARTVEVFQRNYP